MSATDLLSPSHSQPPASPFDAMAADYDTNFTHSRIGTLMRQAVLPRLDAHFHPGDHLLELNCGTGEDALYLAQRGIHVTATDASLGMVQAAQAKIAQAGLTEWVTVHQAAMEELGVQVFGIHEEHEGTRKKPKSPPSLAKNERQGKGDGGLGEPEYRNPSLFDGALSNFGGLNCVEDLREVATELAGCLRPGGMALLCLMGPVCWWEWAWYLGQGKPQKAFRRLKRGGTVWRGLTIRYPSMGAVRRTFAPEFRLRRVSAIGALLPPTYAEEWAGRHPRLLERLARWERRWETLSPLPWLADHYLLELERL